MKKPKGPHRDAAAYGLGVLDDSGAFEEHLIRCARCRHTVAEFRSVAGALQRAVRHGYLPPGDGNRPAPRKRACVLTGRLGSGAGKLLLLAICLTAVTAVVACPAEWVGSAGYIVSPAQVVADSGVRSQDLPRPAGFQ